jgi:hypothetical protein
MIYTILLIYSIITDNLIKRVLDIYKKYSSYKHIKELIDLFITKK